MQAPDPVETILARLMPVALSQSSHDEIESAIDKLAGPEPVVPIRPEKGLPRIIWGGGIAAAAAGLLALAPPVKEFSGAQVVEVADLVPEFMIVSKSDRVESMTDEGWREDVSGSAMHAMRLVAVEENQVRDTESGLVVMVSQTREEILYSPINSF